MKKVIFGIFAHPDDEAFGPCGTLLTEVEAGAELHLITLTAGGGEHSANPDNAADLGSLRLQEWQRSTQLLGATSTHYLGYTDGKLGNDDHLAITDQLEQIVRDTTNTRDDIEIEFITFDLNGLTGHIDHIVASRSASLAFYRLKDASLPAKRLRLYCLSRDAFPTQDLGFAYMEAGRTDHEINETIDASSLLDKIHQVMQTHHSQRADYDWQVKKLGNAIAIDHFIVKD